jgi:hypothetical protein
VDVKVSDGHSLLPPSSGLKWRGPHGVTTQSKTTNILTAVPISNLIVIRIICIRHSFVQCKLYRAKIIAKSSRFIYLFFREHTEICDMLLLIYIT